MYAIQILHRGSNILCMYVGSEAKSTLAMSGCDCEYYKHYIITEIISDGVKIKYVRKSLGIWKGIIGKL